LKLVALPSRSLSHTELVLVRDSGSAFEMILYGFLKSKNNFCPLKRKFEPIFFRKSRPCSGFSCKAIISACFMVFMNFWRRVRIDYWFFA
jgi:hypothetical protein